MFKLPFSVLLILALHSCASKKTTEQLSFNLWQPRPEVTRAPASFKKRSAPRIQVGLSKTTVEICGLKFDEVIANSSSSSLIFSTKSIKDSGLEYRFEVPDKVSVSNEKVGRSAIDYMMTSVSIENPLAPQIPLIARDAKSEICAKVKKYHSQFSKRMGSILRRASSSSISSRSRSAGAQFQLRSSVESDVTREIQKLRLLKSKLIKNYQPVSDRTSLIIYDDLYKREVFEMALIYRAAGHNVRLMALSQLPGLDANKTPPVQCRGERLRECYHVWGDPIQDVSQRAVPSLKGFFTQKPLDFNYKRVSYIPGLIRAYIRHLNSQNPLKGVLLVGNDDHIAPFYTYKNRYIKGGYPLYYERRLATDIFYALPNPVLEPMEVPHYEDTSAWVWSCIDGAGTVSLRTWCLDNEERLWPQPPMSAYGINPVTPHSRTMKIKGSTSIYNQFAQSTFTGIQLDDIVPIGRLYTRNDHDGDKDPGIRNYVDKLMRWHQDLPMLNTSVASFGGGDDYAYRKQEVDQFELTFGEDAQMYASEHFIDSYKCDGRCEYIDGQELMDSFSNPINRSAFLFTAHGSAHGFQIPYAGTEGDIASIAKMPNTRNANMGWNIHPILDFDEDDVSIDSMVGGTLFGTVIANSCDINDFQLLENEIHEKLRLEYEGLDHRPVGQYLLQMEDGGAVNAFVNVDVGWAGTDSYYNAKFIQKMEIAHSTCHDIGEAARLTWYDMLTGSTGGAYWFQLMNRQLLGSPFNPIARKPFHCKKVKSPRGELYDI